MRVRPAFDVLEDRHAGLGLGREPAAFEEFEHDCGEEALSHRIVPEGAHRIRRRNDAHLAAALPECVRVILAPSNRVMDDAVGTSSRHPDVQLVEHELGAQMIGHRSTYHPPAETVEDNREEQDSGPGRHLADIGEPALVWCLGFESTLDEVWCGTSRVASARSARPLAPRCPRQALLFYQLSHLLSRDIDIGELGVNPRRPEGTAAALMNIANERFKGNIALSAPRPPTVSPRTETVQGDAEHPGHRDDAVASRIRCHDLERFPGTEPVSGANHAAALASISRALRSWQFPPPRRRRSSRSGVANPSSRRPTSRSAWPTQLKMVCSEYTTSRGSSRIECSERTMSTIRSRESGGYDKWIRCAVDSSSNEGSVSTKARQLQSEDGPLRDSRSRTSSNCPFGRMAVSPACAHHH